MKIIDRYIMSEMLGPFLFGVCAFTLLFFSAETLMGVAKMILEAQAGVGMVLEYLFNRLPYVLIMTFPMSVSGRIRPSLSSEGLVPVSAPVHGAYEYLGRVL